MKLLVTGGAGFIPHQPYGLNLGQNLILKYG
jgi:hypothetical protein